VDVNTGLAGATFAVGSGLINGGGADMVGMGDMGEHGTEDQPGLQQDPSQQLPLQAPHEPSQASPSTQTPMAFVQPQSLPAAGAACQMTFTWGSEMTGPSARATAASSSAAHSAKGSGLGTVDPPKLARASASSTSPVQKRARDFIDCRRPVRS
jgi:hypothetical protein